MEKGKSRQLDSDHTSTAIPPRDRLSDSPLTYNQFVSGIVDFLEVAFHTILCLRSVYPFDVFARRKKYSHPCYQSRHPGLNEYISRVLAALRSEIEKSSVSKVILVIRPDVVAQPRSGSSNGTGSSGGQSERSSADAYERFIFDLEYIIPSDLIDTRNRDLAISSNVTSEELEQIFRGFMQKLMMVDGMLYDMPPAAGARGNDGLRAAGRQDGAPGTELTFAIVLEMVDEDTSPSGKDRNTANTGDWIPADAENLGRTASSSSPTTHGQAKAQAPKIRPIKTLDSGVINLMLYVEEDLHAKSGHPHVSASSRPSPSKSSRPARPTSAQPLRTAIRGVEDELLLTKATQIDVTTASVGGGARELKNRARRLDAERDLDQPALAEAEAEPDIAAAKGKRKRARMVLGETRAAESDSESSEAPSSPTGSSQSVRDDLGGQLSGGF